MVFRPEPAPTVRSVECPHWVFLGWGHLLMVLPLMGRPTETLERIRERTDWMAQGASLLTTAWYLHRERYHP